MIFETFKIGNLKVTPEIYDAYKNERMKWYIFNIGITWVGVGVFTILAMACWFKFGNAEENIRKKAYIDACKDFYAGKIHAELIQHNNGTREWKYSEKKLDIKK